MCAAVILRQGHHLSYFVFVHVPPLSAFSSYPMHQEIPSAYWYWHFISFAQSFTAIVTAYIALSVHIDIVEN